MIIAIKPFAKPSFKYVYSLRRGGKTHLSAGTDEILAHLKAIDDNVLAIRSTLNMMFLSRREPLLAHALSVFGDSVKRAEVYLATDGARGATKIGRIVSMKRPNVSFEQGILSEAGVIEPDHRLGKGYVYRKVSAYELLGLPQLVKSKFKLG